MSLNRFRDYRCTQCLYSKRVGFYVRKLSNQDEIIELFNKIDGRIFSLDNIIDFIKSKKEPQDDEAVCLNESDRIDLSFEEIKNQAIGNFL